MKLTYYQAKAASKLKPTSGERQIMNFLKKLNIYFIRECSFKNYGSVTNPKRFDFYLPDFKIAIEFDGAFHYLQSRENKDLSKTAFCKAAGILLLRYELHTIHKIYSELPALLK